MSTTQLVVVSTYTVHIFLTDLLSYIPSLDSCLLSL